MPYNVQFTKENIDIYFKELAKEYKKIGGRIPAEILIVGGASILINYDFRYSSFDIDGDYSSVGSLMKECINTVGDRLNLPNGWLNDDFRQTDSYTYKLREFSKHYKTFSNLLEFRTISAEYLVAMKLVSGRKYKSDLSDIAGIFYEQTLMGDPLSFERVDKAIKDLYGNWDKITEDVKSIFQKIVDCKNLKELYVELSDNEKLAKETLQEVEKKYPNKIKESNVDDIILKAMNKKINK